MKLNKAEQFAAYILSQGLVYGPERQTRGLFVRPVKSIQAIDWSGDIPENSFKAAILPPREKLEETIKDKVTAVFDSPKVFCFAMNVLDLQAFTLVEHVFEKDIYYQNRRQNLFIVGYSGGIPGDIQKYDAFHDNFEENVLEHVLFDVFIEKTDKGEYKFFSGSEKGQLLLADSGISDYQNIEFAGLVPEAGMNPRLTLNRKAVEFSENNKLWNELAEICLACGKCSIVCPTCYCFDIRDEAKVDKTERVREWTSCFYPEFSRTSGETELDTLKKKLYFWYYHKFVRIPDKLSYFGCVSCMRCVKVCPVGINIATNLQRLQKENKK
jgi:sulfhydrogenase subunit beta (sulfur reductase)